MPLSRSRLLLQQRYALGSDGVDDYVNCGNGMSLNITDAITVGAWIKPSEYQYDVIAGRIDVSGNNGWVFRRYSSTLLEVALGEATFHHGYTFSYTWRTDWVYTAFTWDGNTVKAYINSQLLGTRATYEHKLPYDPSRNLNIGRYPDYNAQYFIGLIGEVHVYSRALSSDEISWNYNYPGNPIRNGLVLWLPGTDDAIQPPTWYDRSPFANNGTIYGATKTQVIKAPSRLQSPVRVLSAVR
jgi:hypothetical protein